MYLHFNDETRQQSCKWVKIYYNLITILQNSARLVKSKLKLRVFRCGSSTQQHNAKQVKNANKTHQGNNEQPHRRSVRSGRMGVGGGVSSALRPAVTGKQARHHPCVRGYIGL